MRKNILISTVVSILIFILGSVTMNLLNLNKVSNNVDLGEYRIIAGVVRNEGKGWDLINDVDHEPISINKVLQDEEKIIIEYDKNTKVNALSVTVDETMALEGYQVGASVGTDKSYIYIYDKDNNLVNPKDYSNSKGNIWIEGIFRR